MAEFEEERHITGAYCSEHKCPPNDCFEQHYPQSVEKLAAVDTETRTTIVKHATEVKRTDIHVRAGEYLPPPKDLRLVELYASIQGEGPMVGTPTTFVRFGGCNMRCPGWPCDTPYAIEPSQWRNSPLVPVHDIVERCKLLGPNNVCLTGGEPTMQPPKSLEDLLYQLYDEGFGIEMFSNGSLKPFPEFRNFRIMMDWKLRGSGEDKRGLGIRFSNTRLLSERDGIKFVVSDLDDFEEAKAIWFDLKDKTKAQFWVGAAWGKMREADLVALLLANPMLPWKMNIQVHKFIWPEAERGV